MNDRNKLRGATKVALHWALGSCLIALYACATPAQKFTERATHAGLVREELTGRAFRHVVFAHTTRNDPHTLHLYFDGDGTPWTAPARIAADPSARHTFVLDLMNQDPTPAVLLGRPCYYLAAPDPACA